ncbi:histidine phosphatase family protein [Endozoicomonas arenosclerae]|uniref:histidine phosphatase family protein n=1 Tax=Endozoicomonas arenosclerae TaxID=1633495 RepID=UPI0007851E4E|nr:histidine phosphatase family protein [Endozoicomonas arenosclerae]
MTLYFFFIYAQASNADYFVSIIRHGDRAPVRPLEPEQWPYGKGELTDEGIEQCKDIGLKVRESLLSNDFPRQWHSGLSRHYARNFNRTIQSAHAILSNIYPESYDNFESNRVPDPKLPSLVTVPEESLLGGPHACNDRAFYRIIDQLDASKLWQKKKLSLRSWLPKDMSKGPYTMRQIQFLGDALFARKKHNKPLPDEYSLNQEKHLIEAKNWFFEQISREPRIMGMTSHKLLKEILSAFQNYSSCRHWEKTENCEHFLLFVASEINLQTFLAIMGASQDEAVPYGAHLNILLSYNAQKVFLKLDNKPLKLQGCQAYCSYDKWINLLSRAIAIAENTPCFLKSDQLTSAYTKKLPYLQVITGQPYISEAHQALKLQRNINR